MARDHHRLRASTEHASGPYTAQRLEEEEFSGSENYSRPSKGNVWVFLIFR